MVLDTGATAWILAATALVMIMTPGVGFFYGGLVRRKNLISMLALSFVAFALVSIQWVLVGYSLAFGSDIGGFIGSLEYMGLNNVGMEPGPYSAAIPGLLFMVFQLVFAAVTVAIITSGFAERIKFSSFLIFGLLWTTIVYDPLAHWVWGGGWAAQFGALDFAGGTVVHISSGFAALALALVIGKRVGFGKYAMEPNNIPLTILGAALLWFGWFGFNAGSALGANGLAAQAFVTTNIAAAAGGLAWLLISWLHGKPRLSWICQWSNCRAGSNHPRLRVRDTHGSDNHWCYWWLGLLRDAALTDPERSGREPGCMGNSRDGWPLGSTRNRYLCRCSGERCVRIN